MGGVVGDCPGVVTVIDGSSVAAGVLCPDLVGLVDVGVTPTHVADDEVAPVNGPEAMSQRVAVLLL